jgi:hypothetical protein
LTAGTKAEPECVRRVIKFSFKEGTMKLDKRLMLNIALTVALLLAARSSVSALDVGDKAPDFELESSKGGKLKLSDLKGKNVLINFYVLDFSPT